MDSRTQQLHDIMSVYKLKAKDIASITGRELITVRIWRCDTGKTKGRIPPETLELLKIKAPIYAAAKQAAKATA